MYDASPISHRTREQLPQIVGAGGTRRELGDTVLGDRALDERVDVVAFEADGCQAVWHPGRAHEVDDGRGEQFASIIGADARGVRAEQTGGVEVALRVDLCRPAEDGRGVE